MSPKLKVINMSYKPPLKPLILLNTKIPVNQLVVGSIPTAGAKISSEISYLRQTRFGGFSYFLACHLICHQT